MNTKFEQKVQENNGKMEGIVLAIHPHDIYKEVVLVESEGERIYIKKEDFFIETDNIDSSLSKYIRKNIEFKIIATEDNDIYGSRSIIYNEYKEEVIKRLQNGEEINARINGIVKYASFVDIGSPMYPIYALLERTDWALDQSSMIGILKKNDRIKVKLKNISVGGKIKVESVEKYETKTVLDINDFKKGTKTFGTVVNIVETAYYVCIAKNVDVMCSIPTMDIDVGSQVAIVITNIVEKVPNKESTKNFRGKILEIIPLEYERLI